MKSAHPSCVASSTRQVRPRPVLRWRAFPCVLAAAAAACATGVPAAGGVAFRVASYPELVTIPGYPVYFAPQLKANYFFYQGWYWLFEQDRWFRACWYDGPWQPVAAARVPVFILRIPVAYFRLPPVYFSGWRREDPPRWDERWGGDWTRQHSGWDRWDRGTVRAIAPLPGYQRDYSGSGYPLPRRQQQLRNQRYPTLPRDLSALR